MVIINKTTGNRVFDKNINDYIEDISNHIYERLNLLDIESKIVDGKEKGCFNYISVSNSEDNELSDCGNCRNSDSTVNKVGYSYVVKTNQDGNLEEIIYSIDDVSKISSNWLNLAEDIIREVKYNLGYDNYKKLNNKTYQVQKNDNLYQIAKKFNTTVDRLKTLNNLTGDELQVGQVLIVTPDIPTKDFPTFGIRYIVEEDDDLYDIASRFNTTVSRLKQINNLSSNDLYPGQTLIIEPFNNQDEGTITYIVRFGDTLEDVANKYNVDVSEIKALNNLESNNLTIGQVLVIPSFYSSEISQDNYITYIVQSGDSLYRIAKKFDMTVDELKMLNNLDSNLLKIGQKLIVGKRWDNANDSDLGDYDIYTVLPDDNLYSIANKKNITIGMLKSINNLSSNMLKVGQRLKIPR